MSRMTPKQGTRERVYVLMTFLRDDNGDQVEGTDQVLAGTFSEKVGREVLETFKKHRNGHVTMVHELNEARFFPSLLEKILDDAPESKPAPEPKHDIDSLLELVDLGPGEAKK